MMDDREKEIQLLCKQVLDANLEFYDNPNGPYEYTCPFCGEMEGVGGNDPSPTIGTMSHKADCAYLIAKSLSTNLI